jgi:8-oxo-dGTP diphosphatase
MATSGNSPAVSEENQPLIECEIKVIGVKEDRQYTDCQAVRAVIMNVHGDIAIIHAKKEDYFKIPGGGIKEGENHQTAGTREALEEIGCRVKMSKRCLAIVEEWRNDLHQLSYCYVAHVLEDTGATALTEEETGDGLEHRWVHIDVAIKLMKEAQPTSTLGLSIKERDLFFVEKFAAALEPPMEPRHLWG